MTAITRVVGIDASLTSTGVAYVERGAQPIATRFPSVPDDNADWAQRGDRIDRLLADVCDDGWSPSDLVVIEGPAPSRGSQRGTWDRAGMWWGLHRMVSHGIGPVVVVGPGTRAKWATGKGNAGKSLVVAAIARLCDVEIVTDDIADAIVLALMGAQHLGWRPDLDTKYRSEALAAVKWPNLDGVA